MRIVLDTNVLFAAFRLESGFCADLFRACVLRHEIVISEHILEELQRHLSGKGKLFSTKVVEVLKSLRSFCLVVIPAAVPISACRDVEDLPVLGTAIAGRASVLVTGDKDLLVLNPFQGISILSPRDFHVQYIAPQT